MFKGFDKAKDIQYVYTPVFSSLCGVKLDYNNKAGYLLSGICVCHIFDFRKDKNGRESKTYQMIYFISAFQEGTNCSKEICFP